MFSFSGEMILSKSWLNRAQIVYHFAQKSFPFQSEAEDVRHLKAAITGVGSESEFFLGQGGTSFRFFVFLISRRAGSFKIFADTQLLKRPQGALLETLKQLGVTCETQENCFQIKSQGWSYHGPVTCDAGLSSQFVSGLLLSSWQLKSDLTVKVLKPVKSEEYLKMTIELLQQAGMKMEIKEEASFVSFTVFKDQAPDVSQLAPEADISSAFSLAAASVVNGAVTITNWPQKTSQPDMAFLSAFDQMQIKYEIAGKTLKVQKHNTWRGCDMNVGSSPDLFPVLSVLCALGEGKSKLHGAAHLKVKESDRLAKTAELLKICGVRFEELSDGLIIYGQSFADKAKSLTFYPSGDHRMAMAAALFKLHGFKLDILDRECVAKSYPGFWRDVGL